MKEAKAAYLAVVGCQLLMLVNVALLALSQLLRVVIGNVLVIGAHQVDDATVDILGLVHTAHHTTSSVRMIKVEHALHTLT